MELITPHVQHDGRPDRKAGDLVACAIIENTNHPYKLALVRPTISSRAFFAFYYGHDIDALALALNALRGNDSRALVFLAGDSTLDNKFYVLNSPPLPASNGYEHILAPPACAPDVTAHLSRALLHRGLPLGAINCAVEEATVRALVSSPLDGAPALLARALSPRDVLVVSAGGNDVVLFPTARTVAALATVLSCGSGAAIDAGTAFGFGTLEAIFYDGVQKLVDSLCARAAPALLVVCFPYFPQEASPSNAGGWADGALSLLGYDRAPGALQRVMRAVFSRATRRVRGPAGTRVAHLALFDVLDARADSADYVGRVEPSAEGGRKIAEAIAGVVARELSY